MSAWAPASRPSRVTTVSARIVHIVGNAATAPAASGPARRLVTTAAPTITDAAAQVSAVVDQRRGDPGRGRPAGMSRGASASTGIADATAKAGGSVR